jgi:hypothetical protein
MHITTGGLAIAWLLIMLISIVTLAIYCSP